jgi:hypothetical protein
VLYLFLIFWFSLTQSFSGLKVLYANKGALLKDNGVVKRYGEVSSEKLVSLLS